MHVGSWALSVMDRLITSLDGFVRTVNGKTANKTLNRNARCIHLPQVEEDAGDAAVPESGQ